MLQNISEVLHDETDFGVNSGYDEAEANAKLIAAAPELLLLITAFSNVNVFSPKDVAELTVEADKLIQKASP